MKIIDWARRLLGIRADTFVSVDQIRQAESGPGKVGQGLDSNVVMAPIQWIMRTFTQALPVVEKKRAGVWKRAEEHDVELLLAAPNEFYDGDALFKGSLLSFFIDGNGYLLKVRSTLRKVVELWYVPHWLIEPKWPDHGSTFISHYEYRPLGTAIRVATEDVVHLRFGIDPRNTRVGLSPLKAVLREVLTDEEASAFSAYILHNMGVPGGVISPKDASVMPTEDDVKEMKEFMTSGFTGKNRGKWLVIGAPTEISQFGFDPNRLMLGPLRDISEERVCAMLGIPAAVVGFGAGLQQTKVGATMRELVRLARVNCVEPTQVSIARQLSRQLLPDFETQPHRARISFDNSGVSMFAEDLNDAAERATTLFEAKIIGREQAQRIAGVEPDEVEDAAPEPAPTPGTEPTQTDPPPANRMKALVEPHLNGGAT